MTGLMVGAALFLPHEAFAEKNEPSEELESKKAVVEIQKPDNEAQAKMSEKAVTVQAAIPAKQDKAKSLEKTNLVVTEPAKKNKIQPANTNALKNASQKQVNALQNLPEQAKGHLKTAIKKTEKAARKLTSPKVNTDNKGQNKKEQVVTKNDNKSVKPKEDKKIKTIYQPEKPNKTSDDGVDFLKSKKGIPSNPLVSQSPLKEKAPVPASKEEIPDVNQVLNSAQRTSQSGGQAPDRVNNGVMTISLLDKWFVEWNKFYQNNLAVSFLSRESLMNSQWVNAPPSPPPQNALLVETVNRS